MALLDKCLCPHCFEEIYLGKCTIVSGKRRIINPITNEEEGEVIETPWGGPLAATVVKPLDGPKYAMEAARRRCTNENCRYELPYNIELVPSLTLAVVGHTFSGKSHYIAALIHQIKNEWQRSAAGLIRLTCLTPSLEADYIKSYNTLGQPSIGATLPGQPGKQPKPLIYNVVSTPDHRRPPTEFNLLIYDVAGEDFRAQNLLHFGNFVVRTNSFIFVADPFAIPDITNRLPPTLLANNKVQNMMQLRQQERLADGLNSTIDLLKLYRKIPKTAKLHGLPVAIMLSKSDLLQQFQPPPSYTFLKKPSSGYGCYLNSTDIAKVHAEVEHLLKACNQYDLLNAMRGFELANFFATSATGKPPDQGTYNQFSGMDPHRCLDPFLWILYQLGVIGKN